MNTKQKTPLNADTWGDILNGSIEPDLNNKEQLEAAYIRAIILEKEAKKELDIMKPEEISEELAAHLESEKKRFFNIINQQKKTIHSVQQQQQPQQPNLIQKLISFFNKYKLVIAPVALASLLGVTVLPILLNQTTSTEQIAYKGIEASPPVISLTSQPQATATRIKKEFETAGLSVELKQTEKGWLLRTELPVPIFKHPDVIAVMKNNNIAAAIGSNLLTLLFIKE